MSKPRMAMLYFVYLPEWLRYSHPKAASGQRDAVLRMARSAGIPVIDIDPVFRADGDPLVLYFLSVEWAVTTNEKG